MIPHSNGSDSSFSAEAVKAVAGAFKRAGTPTGSAGTADQASGRRSRAGAGGRLKDLLQQEAKDLRVRCGLFVYMSCNHSMLPAYSRHASLTCAMDLKDMHMAAGHISWDGYAGCPAVFVLVRCTTTCGCPAWLHGNAS